MASGRIDTMTDYLRQILTALSEAKIVADADLPFLLSLEQQVVAKLRDPVTKMQQMGVMPAGAQQVPAGGADPGMMGGAGMGAGVPALPPGFGADAAMPMPPSGAGAGGVRGVPTGPPQINPDELRRMLTANR